MGFIVKRGIILAILAAVVLGFVLANEPTTAFRKEFIVSVPRDTACRKPLPVSWLQSATRAVPTVDAIAIVYVGYSERTRPWVRRRPRRHPPAPTPRR